MARPLLDVRAFGAAGDGLADDRGAVVRALYAEFVPSGRFVRRVPRVDRTRGAVLYFPAGRYRIVGPLERLFDLDHLTIVGDGPGVTSLVFDHRTGHARRGVPPHLGALPRVSAGGHPGGATTGFTLEGLTLTTDRPQLDAPTRAIGASPLSVGWCRGVRITDVEVADAANTGMYLYHCEDVRIERCHVHHVDLDGVHVSRSTDVTVRDCHIHDTGDDAIGVSGTPDRLCRNVVIASNEVARSGSNGISLFGVEGAAVTANHVAGTYMCGITVRPWPGCGGTQEVTIEANRVDDAGLHPADGTVPDAPLWGGGIPSGIAVANDTAGDPTGFVDVPLGPVRIRHNVVGACRNSFVTVRRGHQVVVEGNDLQGLLVDGPRAHDHGVGERAEGSGVSPPPEPYDRSGGPVAVWVRDSDDVRVGGNRLAAAVIEQGARPVLIERPAAIGSDPAEAGSGPDTGPDEVVGAPTTS